MAQRTISLCLVLGLLAAAASANTANASTSFDFYYLVLMWPGAYCVNSEHGCCVPKYGHPAEDFLVQSFMTFDSSQNTAVVGCNSDEPFDMNRLEPIENNLKHHWSNIKCPRTDGTDTWKSEWGSYGVCSGLTEVDYFRAALNLQKNADVLGALAEQGINPDYRLYNVEFIKWAVNQKIGVTPGVQCRDGPFGKKQLYQLFLCVHKNGKTFIDCPTLPKLHCPEEVLFHPFRTWMLNAKSPAKISLPRKAMSNCDLPTSA